jgi:hypothetical protein
MQSTAMYEMYLACRLAWITHNNQLFWMDPIRKWNIPISDIQGIPASINGAKIKKKINRI